MIRVEIVCERPTTMSLRELTREVERFLRARVPGDVTVMVQANLTRAELADALTAAPRPPGIRP